jgi:hypothetical protein
MIDLTALQQWKNEVADPTQLILKPIELERTNDYVDIRTGVKGNMVMLPILDDNGDVVDGSVPGFNPTSGPKVSQFPLTTSPYKINKEIALIDLEKYFTGQWLADNSYPDTFAVLDEWVSRVIAKNSLTVGQIEWLADIALTTFPFHIKHSNGFLKQIDNSSDAQKLLGDSGKKLGLTNSATTHAVIDVFDQLIYQKLPTSALFGRPIAFCGTDVFRLLQNAIKNANLFHYNPADYGLDPTDMVMPYFNSGVLVVGIAALNSSAIANQPLDKQQRIVVTYADNLAVGVCAENDPENFDIWYNQDAETLRLKMRYHLGVGVKFTDLVATFKLTPTGT